MCSTISRERESNFFIERNEMKSFLIFHFFSLIQMSFIPVDPNSDFSYENLPYGIFSTDDNVTETIQDREKGFSLNEFRKLLALV